MKNLFIPAYRKTEIPKKEIFDKLPEKIFLVYSIQYKPLAEKIKKILGKKVNGFQQVLGCSEVKTNLPILLIGSARFHSNNLIQKEKDVWIFDEGKLEHLDKKDFKFSKTALIKYLNSDKIGILVSTKYGQENLSKAIKFKSKSQKQSYLFICDSIDTQEFENFGLDSWINTACPNIIGNSKNIVNLSELN